MKINFQLRAVLALATVFMITLSAVGCRVVKRSVSLSDSLVAHDTVRVLVAIHDSFIHEKTVNDTVIGEAGHEISIQYVHDTIVRNGNVRLSVRGKTIDCSADSLTLVLHNVVQERDRLINREDSSYTEGQRSVSSRESAIYSEQSYPVWRKMIGWLTAAVVGIIVWEAVKKVRQLFMV